MDGGVGEVDCGVHREIGGWEDQREFEWRLNFWALTGNILEKWIGPHRKHTGGLLRKYLICYSGNNEWALLEILNLFAPTKEIF